MSSGVEPDTAVGQARTAVWMRALVAVLIALIILGGVSAARLAGKLRDTRLFGASDSATILALAGVRDFAERADIRSLMLTPLGADSLVMKAKVFVGDGSMGTYAVQMVREAPQSFRLRSTGRLKSGDESMVCSVDVLLRFSETGEPRPSAGLEQPPLCNGSRHESAVIRVSNIGS
jgi:hypothetical protein